MKTGWRSAIPFLVFAVSQVRSRKEQPGACNEKLDPNEQDVPREQGMAR